MLPEYRIFGGLILFAVLGTIWIVIELVFGKSASEAVFGTLGAIFIGLFVVLGFIYAPIAALFKRVREKLWWWSGPESAIRVLLRWREKGCKDAGTVAAALRALPDWRVHARSLDGETALHAVIRLRPFLGEHFEPILEHLLAAGADPNARYEYNGWTLLKYCEWYEAPPEVAARLQAAGADPTAQSSDF
jgi:hypothetical protein